MAPNTQPQARPEPPKEQVFPPPKNIPDNKPPQQQPQDQKKQATGWKIFN